MLVGQACSDSDDAGTPPEIPPTASMQMNYDELPSQSQQPKALTSNNVNVAYFSAVAASLILEANLAIPKALLVGAQNNSPTYMGDGEWEWEYSASGPEGSYSVRLTALVDNNNNVEWNFYVSADNGQVTWDDVRLFSGTSTLDGTEGSWSIYRPIQGGVATTTTWMVTDETTDIEMTVYNSSDEVEATVAYSLNGTTKVITFENLSDDTETTIQWDTETKVGFIISTDYNNGQQACWDENFEDVACTS
jgi:hypothetical protein